VITFRKFAAGSNGKLIRMYFTETSPGETNERTVDAAGRQLDPGGRLTSYYTARNAGPIWRQDMPASVAQALGLNPNCAPQNEELDRLFEGKRADTGAAWSKNKREISGYDFTFSPHKSVTLAAEFAASPAESAAIREAIWRANEAAMRYIAQEIGYARRGNGGQDGAEPGDVGWVSFRHHIARPTLPVRDGRTGATYLMEAPIAGDPHDHIHNAMFNLVVTEDGRVGSLDTQRLHSRVHEFGAFAQAVLADELRRLGISVGYDEKEQAVVALGIPQIAVETFSKSREQILGNAKAFADAQGLDWNEISAEKKAEILSQAGLAARLEKHGSKNDRDIWRAQADAIGWTHATVLNEMAHPVLPDAERFERAYAFAARHLAREFHTAAVIDHDKLRTYAARGLIAVGVAGGDKDIDHVVALIEQKGIELKGENVTLVSAWIKTKSASGSTKEALRVTNSAQIRVEEDLKREAARAALDKSGSLPTAAIRQAIAGSGLDFESEPDHGAAQKAAIYALGRGGALTLLTGVAGAGKSTLLRPLVTAWKADTRFDARGREIIGVSTAWNQADQLQETGIEWTRALDPFLKAVEKGEIALTQNTILVIDEISQIAPRPMLQLLELQARTGMTIKALGDREQAQAIEAGDTIEIIRRALPKSERPEILSTIRQLKTRDREIAGLFRDANAKEALEMKRDDGTAILAGGDYDQVVARIADLYLTRRDILQAAGSKRGITISALTNEDAANISKAIRSRLKERGEIGANEIVYRAVAPGGDKDRRLFELPVAIGDSLRLYQRTRATVHGKNVPFGNNGHIVKVVGQNADGLVLEDKKGRIGEAAWENLIDKKTGRLMLGFGHALTIDAAQGLTSDEHINALPRGTAGITAFKAYVAESRAKGDTWTIISEAAVFEAEKRSRALGDAKPVEFADLWKRIGADMSEKPYKALALDLVDATRRARNRTVDSFISQSHTLHAWASQGHDAGRHARETAQETTFSAKLADQLAEFNEAVKRNVAQFRDIIQGVDAHLRGKRAEPQSPRQAPEAPPTAAPAPQPSSPSPGP